MWFDSSFWSRQNVDVASGNRHVQAQIDRSMLQAMQESYLHLLDHSASQRICVHEVDLGVGNLAASISAKGVALTSQIDPPSPFHGFHDLALVPRQVAIHTDNERSITKVVEVRNKGQELPLGVKPLLLNRVCTTDAIEGDDSQAPEFTVSLDSAAAQPRRNPRERPFRCQRVLQRAPS